MRKIFIDNVKPGVINAKAIYSFSNRELLLNQGVAFCPEFIRRLKQRGIFYVYVEDDISEGIVPNEMISENLAVTAKKCFADVAYRIRKTGYFDDAEILREIVNRIIEEIYMVPELAINISDIRASDDYTYAHSVSVCVMSIILGKALALSSDRLCELGIGAIMHDVGKIMVPPEILNKPDRLTDEEMEIIKQHSNYGAQILARCPKVGRNVVNTALMHHERCDGSGYQNGLYNNQIHLYAKIVSVTDVFDAMTSDRVYRKGLDTSEVVKYMSKLRNKSFDGHVLDKFIKKIILYPSGSLVILNTGEKAIVVKSSVEAADRPIVRIITDKAGNKLKKFIEVDLKENHYYKIVSLIDEI